jgi:NADH-quinone oxidoreductase subunit M
MNFIENYLLTLILFTPVVVAVILVFLPKEEKSLLRWVAFIGSLIPLALSIFVWFRFDSNLAGFQFEEKFVWYEPINSSYHVGVDGLSLTMVLLTTLLTPVSLLASFSITERVKPYMILFLLLETGMLGVFLSLDLLIFFVFWEIGLVPMFFLINQWGSEKGERTLWGGRTVSARAYASFKFMIYTMAGSLGLLLAIQMIGVAAGTYDMQELFRIIPSATTLPNVPLNLPVATVKAIAFWAFVIAFAIKVPVWPFHTWLLMLAEAPTAGS